MMKDRFVIALLALSSCALARAEVRPAYVSVIGYERLELSTLGEEQARLQAALTGAVGRRLGFLPLGCHSCRSMLPMRFPIEFLGGMLSCSYLSL